MARCHSFDLKGGEALFSSFAFHAASDIDRHLKHRHVLTVHAIHTRPSSLIHIPCLSMVADEKNEAASIAASSVERDSFIGLETMASKMFHKDVVSLAAYPCASETATTDDDDGCLTTNLTLEPVHELVTTGPCLDSPVNEEVLPPPTQVEVTYDGSKRTIVSSGLEDEVVDVDESSKRTRQQIPAHYYNVGSIFTT